MSAALTGVTGKPRNLLTQPLYDSGSIATSGTIKISFFTTPLSNGATAFQGSGVKTYVDTNMRQASQLPHGWRFDVFAIALAFWTEAATMAADIAEVLTNSFFRFVMGGSVEWLVVPAKFLLGGIGVDGFAEDTNTTVSRQAAHNGQAHPDAIFKLEFPIPIVGGETFEGELVWPTAPTPTAAVAVTCMLHGRLDRAA